MNIILFSQVKLLAFLKIHLNQLSRYDHHQKLPLRIASDDNLVEELDTGEIELLLSLEIVDCPVLRYCLHRVV